MRLFTPEVFQGSLRRRRYFEGWYHKHVSADGSRVLALIPGVSLSPGDRHAFIQVIDGATARTHYRRYPLERFCYDRRCYSISLAGNRFGLDGLDLDIHPEDGFRPEILDGEPALDLRLKGSLAYHQPQAFPRGILRPGIMGPYSHLPFMQCFHGVVSADHSLSGCLEVEGLEGHADGGALGGDWDFNGGRGYIEKDWGSSFPDGYIWMQGNSFGGLSGTSFMLSVARIPWLGSSFIGFLGFVFYEGQYRVFATYTGSRIVALEDGNHSGGQGRELSGSLVDRQGRLSFRVRSSLDGPLRAPVQGRMKRIIKESIDAELSFRLETPDGRVLVESSCGRVGFEVVGDIVDWTRRQFRL